MRAGGFVDPERTARQALARIGQQLAAFGTQAQLVGRGCGMVVVAVDAQHRRQGIELARHARRGQPGLAAGRTGAGRRRRGSVHAAFFMAGVRQEMRQVKARAHGLTMLRRTMTGAAK